MPFLFKFDLIHVDVNGGDVLIAALDSGILEKWENESVYKQPEVSERQQNSYAGK